ncbi:hypothetical protein ACFXTO_003259 [Malus domestica]
MQALSAGFQMKFDRSRFNYKITLLPLFIAKYKVPWILKWNYEVETGEVYRSRLVKWWDKFNHKTIINLVFLEFLIPQVPAIPAQPTMALPTILEQSLLDISLSSSIKGTTKSSKSTSSKQKEKSSQLNDLAQQLMAETTLLHDEGSDSDASDASS